MKKVDLIHTTILIVAILAGYQAIQHVIGLLSILAFTAEADMFRRATSQFVYTVILAISFAILCAILVKNGRNYAVLMLKDEPEGSWEDAPKWDLDRRNVLFVLMIGIGIYSLIQSIPNLLSDFYTVFSDKVGSNLDAPSRRDALVIALLKTLIGFLLIYAAPNLTNFIEKTIAVRLIANDSRS